MKINVAKHIGFCFGVRRAVNIAEGALRRKGRFFCLGPLIHNPQEVRRLSAKGLKTVNKISGLKKGGALIIRSHGLLPVSIKDIRRRGMKLIDATCPFVKKAQGICDMLVGEGFDVIVIGDKRHPEVKALAGFAGGRASVVENIRDIRRIRPGVKKIGVLAQTTQSRENFQDLVSGIFKKHNKGGGFDEIRIFNTICADSSARQAAAGKISSVCDVMLVIGGRNSANSRRLANICKPLVRRTHHIETAQDIKTGWFKKNDCVGLVSGASTPNWIITDVIKRIKEQKQV